MTSASRATGRSLVPAVMTDPASDRACGSSGSQDVRPSWPCLGKVAGQVCGLLRVDPRGQAILTGLGELRMTPATHSQVLPSQKMTSGKPHRWRRCRSTWA